MSVHLGPRRLGLPRSTKIVVVCALLLASSALPIPVLDGWLPLPSLNAASGEIDGRVFDDLDGNGADDAEPGVAGITVEAWTAGGAVAASTTTAGDGSYTLTGLNDATTYRVEFSNLPAGYESGPIGPDNDSAVVFTAPDTSGVDFGVLEPTVCHTPPANALLYTYAAAVTCSAVVDPAFPKDSFGLLDIDNSIPASGAVDTTTSTPMFHHPDWHIDQIGNVFGVAIDNRRGDIYTAASSNWSHEFYTNTGGTRPSIVQYGLIGGGANDLGAAGTVYRLDAVSGAPAVFAQLPQQLATFTHVECEQDGTSSRTSGVGLGNVLYDEVNDQLFVSNWEDGHIYRLDMAGTILDAYDPGATDDGTPGMANGIVPFGLELNADSSRLFFGTVFSQEIWSIDLAAGGFTGPSSVIGGTTVHADAPSEQSNVTITLTGGEPTPSWLNGDPHYYVSDLELLPNGEMLAGLRVGCNDSPHSAYNHRGQTHRVSADGGGFFVNDLGALDVSATGDAGLDDNYGGVGYYNHPDGSVDYAVSSADILSEAGPHGLAVFHSEDATGSPIAPIGAIDYGTTNDPKGISGDVEVLNLAICTPSDIEVGDYVWFDVDGDGVQDPDEPALVGVTVRLLSADGSTVIATTTTDAAGQYVFGTVDGLDTLTNYLIEFDVSTNTTPLPSGVTNADLIETVANAGEGTSSDPDANDSDVVANRIAITTGGPGENDHTHDAGYTLPFDLALTKTFTSDTFGSATDAILENGADATFTITVVNQGLVDAGSFTVTDHLPAGFVLNDGAWTDNLDGTASRTAGPLAAGDSVDLTITLRADGAADGAHVNWAEISADDGNDVDSTPDSNVANDNQPAAPGDPTDDVTDNSVDGAGDPDEDDHDPAGVTVQTYDLALTKAYTSDTSGDGNATDGVIELGDDVTFTITVTNQGSQPMTSATVTDHMPVGFVLNDAGWTDNSDGTASRDVGPLAPGASTSITITMTAATSGAGDLVNWAEISADDGNDVDSTPDSDVANDNQPAGPGDPTDDVIDNSVDGAGDPDEDDHDPAGITVDAYDLALTKVFTSDTFGVTTDGVVQNGSDATFTITVENQGTLAATAFTVTDHLPAGFVLNDGAWTDNLDGTASRTAGLLGAGASLDLTITLRADAAADGAHVNWAEISADDGNDVDSTPDENVANDNQPAAPGAPTDDATDNSLDGAGDPDEDDHDPAPVTVVSYDLALTKAYTSDSFANPTDGSISSGADVTFTITVVNQGTLAATAFTVTDHLPAGFVLNDGAWTDNLDGTASRIAGPLALGASIDLPITLTATTATAGEHVNWAEISLDDGDDVDSTPDSDVANDNQPAAPGAPTDDVTDNSVDGAGDPDEDDHDPAGVTLSNYDLALTKAYTSDTFGSTTDGIVQNGADATFTVTVTNQGTANATAFTVTDHLPAGFVLNDGAWTDNLDGTASRTAGPLAPGASVDLPITLRADAAADGAHVNWAEISADDGDDVDSTPDSDVANDNQPTGPGAPTDDVIDNSVDGAGDPDEDDHDPAGITVQSYDLALTKAYTSDTFGVTTDGIVQEGSTARFTITVTNQGSLRANSFTVTDHIPAGFQLSDAAWSSVYTDQARRTFGPLDPGESLQATIDLLVTDSAALGDHVNWAEISADDGDDVDSAPDGNVANDNQPAAPGDPTDDVIDNSVDGSGDPDEDDHDPAGIRVERFDLALTKAYTSDTYTAPTDGVIATGSDVTFTITVTNQGTLPAVAFTVTDHIPTGFVLNDGAWTDNLDGTASRTAGPLLAGASTDLTITLTAATATGGDHINWAEISAHGTSPDVDSTPDTNPNNDNQPTGPGAPTDDVTDNSVDGAGDPDEDDHDPAGVTVSNYDLALVKAYLSDTFGSTTDGIVHDGADVTFRITVTNQGDTDATTATITDHLPAGFVLNDGAWTDNLDGTASRTVGPIVAGRTESVDITLQADGAADGDHVNWAEISADDGDDIDSTPDSNPANDNQPGAPGDPTDDVIDNSVDGAGDPDEDDHDPAGVTVVSYDLALTKAYTSDTFGLPNDGLVQPGFDVTFTITVTNQGTQDASVFTITDHLPAGFVLNDGAWTDNLDGTASIQPGPLAAGASVDVPITLRALTTVVGDHVNWAEISADDGDDVDSTPDANVANDNQPAAPGDPTDDVIDNSVDSSGDPDEDDHDPAAVTVQVYDLALVKAYTSDSFANPTDGIIATGSDVTFTITVTNQGNVDATTATITDHLPAGFVLNDGVWTDNLDGTASRTIGPLAAGDSTDITITVSAATAGAGNHVNWAEISADDGDDHDSTADGNVSNDAQPAFPGDTTDDVIDNRINSSGQPDEDDHDPAGVQIENYDLALTKVYTSDTFGDPNDAVIQDGDDATFTITVFNQGTEDATTFQVTDRIPAGFVLNDSAWIDNGDGTASRTGGPLLAGHSVELTITMTAVGVPDGTHVNVAEITFDDGDDVDSTPDDDDDTQDDQDDAELTVASYDLALAKAYTSDTHGAAGDAVVEPGANVTWTITVTNEGTLDATTFDVTDRLPAGFVLDDPRWTDNGDGTATRAAGPLVAGDSLDLEIITQVVTTTPGTYVNEAEISSDDGEDTDSTPDDDDDTQDDQDDDQVTVEVYDLALTKRFESDTHGSPTDAVIQPGSDVTFTISVTNQGTVDATAVSVTDHLPVGFVLNDGSWTDNGDGTATRTTGAIPAGDTMDLPITLTAAGSAAGDFVNWAEISADDGNDIDSLPDTIVGNDNQPDGPGASTDDATDNRVDAAGDPDEDDHDPAGVMVEIHDLALVKRYDSDDFGDATDGVVQNGSLVTFEIEVINQGTVDAGPFTITDHLPAGFVLDDSTWTDNTDGTASFDVSSLRVGERVTVPIILRADAAIDGTAVNIAEISADAGIDLDSTPDDDETNDKQPSAPGEPTDDVTDNSTDSGGDPDEDDHDLAGVLVASHDLALTKAYTSDTHDVVDDGVVEPGDDVVFTITVTNQGTLDATDFTITDHLPAGFVLNDAAWTDNGDGTASIDLGSLSAGSSVDQPITLRVAGRPAGDAVNWAEISADAGDDVDSTPDSDVANDNQPTTPGDPTDDVIDNSVDSSGDPDEDDHDPAGVRVERFDLALAKAYTSDTSVDGEAFDAVIQPGDDVLWTITVTNEGSVDATAFEVTDHLPAGFVLNDAAWTDNADGTASRTVGALPAGDSIDLPIATTAVSPGAGVIVNVAEISDDQGDDADSTPDDDPSDDEDDIDDAEVTVDAYDLALTKRYVADTFGAVDDGVVLEGEEVTFSITVTNQGTVPSSVVQITDHIPAGFELTDTDWELGSDGSTATRDVGPTAAGESTTVDITLRVVDASTGEHVNRAEISADDGNDIDSTTDGDPDNDGPVVDDDIDNTDGDEDDHDPATVTVVPVFDLALRKQLADPSAVVRAGDLVTFTITVFNQGQAAARDIALIDYVPSGLALADADWTSRSDGDATIVLDGELEPGDSTSVDITLRVVDGVEGSLENFAEITAAEAVDVLGTAIVLPSGDPLPDIDSVPDATDDEDPLDDELANAEDDEDDHDIAILAVAETPQPDPPGPLALTGREAGGLVGFALVLLMAGAVAVMASRRSSDETVYYY